jgi:hypothetical protein
VVANTLGFPLQTVAGVVADPIIDSEVTGIAIMVGAVMIGTSAPMVVSVAACAIGLARVLVAAGLQERLWASGLPR